MFVFYFLQRKKKIKNLGNAQLIQSLSPFYKPWYRKIKMGLFLLALFFLILGLSNLQKSGKVEKVEHASVDIMLALDVSNSMYAQDALPSRLEKAKLFIGQLLDAFQNERVGLVLFAGRSYLSVPITSDMNALKLNLTIARPEQIPTQGTVIAEALALSAKSFPKNGSLQKAVILISDGEDHEEAAISEAKKLSQLGIMFCTVGCGSEQGAKIPFEDGFKTDKDGNEVISKMNEAELQSIADAGQGIYLTLNNVNEAAKEIATQMQQLKKGQVGESLFTQYDSYYQYFLFTALILLLIELLVREGKSRKKIWSYVSVVLIIVLPNKLLAQNKDNNIYRGNAFYKKGQYENAVEQYAKSIKPQKNGNDQIAKFNMGNALFKLNNKEQALQVYNEIGVKVQDKKMKAQAYYNAGNVCASDKKWQEAINYYKASLKNNPNDANTKYNLVYAQKKLQEQQKQKEQKEKQKPRQNKDANEPNDPKDPSKPNDGNGNNDKRPQDNGNENNQDEPKQNNQNKSMPSKLSKDQADKILNALGREEQKIKEKKEKAMGGLQQLEKDW